MSSIFACALLMSTAIRSFLNELQKLPDADYQELPSSIRKSYGTVKNSLFGDWK